MGIWDEYRQQDMDLPGIGDLLYMLIGKRR